MPGVPVERNARRLHGLGRHDEAMPVLGPNRDPRESRQRNKAQDWAPKATKAWLITEGSQYALADQI